MALPEARVVVEDGALTIVTTDASRTQAKVGVCSAGPLNTPTLVADLSGLLSTFGAGPVVEAAALVLARGGGPVVVVRSESTAGTSSSVTKAGTAGTATMTVSGAPVDAYEVVVTVSTAGTSATTGQAALTFSVNGGVTTSEPYALPVSGALVLPNTGLTVSFGAGTLGAGDTYSFTTTAPSASLVQLGAAVDALLASTESFSMVHVVAVPADATAAAALFGSLSTKMDAAAAAFRYIFAIMEAPEVADATLKTTFLSLSSRRVAVGAGFALVSSATNGPPAKRNAAWLYAARAPTVALAQEPAQVDLGPLEGVLRLFRDENSTPGLTDARFCTLRTFTDQGGFYLTESRMMAATGSDYTFWPERRVVDRASSIIRAATLLYVHRPLRVNRTNGRIVERDAVALEADCVRKLEDGLRGQYSSLNVTVNRMDNLLSTRQLKFTVRIVPFARAREIVTSVGLLNPAVTQ